MTLDSYLQASGKSLKEVALAVGVSSARLSQLRHETSWPAELALDIERVTDGALNASFLSATVAKARAA